MFHSSAPGKLMLFGEHSVVYGNPCIATSINKRIDVYLNAQGKSKDEKEQKNTTINALGIKAKFPSTFLQHKFLNLTIAKFFEKYGQRNFELSTKPMPKGLGSSSAVVVAAVKCLSAFYNLDWSNAQIFKFSYEIVKECQNGNASGYDVAVAVYGGTIRYENKNENIKLKKLKSVKNLIAIHTGIASSTTDLVREISEKRNKYKEIFEGIFKIINKIVDEGEKEIMDEKTNKDFEKFGELMNINQGILNAMGLSCYEIEELIEQIKPYCYGVKISGAGRGDYVIAACKEQSKNDLMNYLSQRKIEYFEILPDRGVEVEILEG